MPAVPSPRSFGALWKDDPARVALRALYAEVDALLADYTCDASTECCQFGVTGREPYPTAVELSEVLYAMAGAGVAPVRQAQGRRRGARALPMADDRRRCPLLSEAGRCRIYESRPFGCRTFFCDRAHGPGKMPRAEIQRISRAIADLAAQHAPRDPLARPLTSALDAARARGR